MKTKNENPELPPILVRLQQFIDHQQLTIYQVNKESGLCKGLLINAFNKRQGLTTSTLEAILTAFPQLNANWLLVGRGQMLNPTSADGTSGSVDSLASSSQQHLQNLEQLQQQCVEMLKQIQLMKQKEQADADARLLNSLI